MVRLDNVAVQPMELKHCGADRGGAAGAGCVRGVRVRDARARCKARLRLLADVWCRTWGRESAARVLG